MATKSSGPRSQPNPAAKVAVGRCQNDEAMVRRAAVLVVALLGSLPRAGAADEPSAQWKYDNPFCQVVAAVVPIPAVVASTAAVGGDTRYAVNLFTPAGTTLGAHVTLISETDAYDAAVADSNLSGTPDDRKLEPLIVTLPNPDKIDYFFVDSYSLDHGAAVTCPSYVFAIGETLSSAPTGLRSIEAQHLQKIPPLRCGKLYTDPGLRGDLTSPVGAYGGKPLTVVARAYIDSNGYSIKDEIVQSSGVDGMDKYMLGAVGVHQFRPAQFLCVPVVGEMLIELKYLP